MSSLLTIRSPWPVLPRVVVRPEAEAVPGVEPVELGVESAARRGARRRSFPQYARSFRARRSHGAALSRLRPMPNLVTLCTGNAARSVMAGAILAEHVPALVVATRGTHVVEGMPMSWRTRDAIVGARREGRRPPQPAARGAPISPTPTSCWRWRVSTSSTCAAATPRPRPRTARSSGSRATCPRRRARWRSGWRRCTSPTSCSSRGKTSTTPPAASPRCSTLRGRDPRAAQHPPSGAREVTA